MPIQRFGLALLAILFVAAAGLPPAGQSLPGASEPFRIPDDDSAIVHVLNRLGYGPRPGDVERVRAIGLAQYIEQQLRPEGLSDAIVQERLRTFGTLRMSTSQIVATYYLPIINKGRNRRPEGSAPSNGIDQTGERVSGEAGAAPSAMMDGGPSDTQGMPEGRQTAAQNPLRKDRLALDELSRQRLLRATYSERQLEEVMVEFWFNHFNVFSNKDLTYLYLTEYERDAIRPHALGKFRDLLGAVAESPAMLLYLDNWMSADPASYENAMREWQRRRKETTLAKAAERGSADPVPRINVNELGLPRPPQKGLNENYARELLELHTLGVDGGYTQKDVVEVARAFTGWTLGEPRRGEGFRFDPLVHDRREKVVLGQKIVEGGGKDDGTHVLDLLAAHPSTARFIATKLVRRFVADEPPAGIVDRATSRFEETKGDIREVLRTILTSPEFFAPEARHAKVKTPLEFVVSAVRVTNARVDDAAPLLRELNLLGMPLYSALPPTGYADTADAWVSTGSLIRRMNFAVSLVSGRLPGISIDLASFGTADESSARQRLLESFLLEDVSPGTQIQISRAKALPQVAVLAIGSPEFQRR